MSPHTHRETRNNNRRPNNRPRYKRRCWRHPADSTPSQKSMRRNKKNHDGKRNVNDIGNSRIDGDDRGNVMDDVLAQLRRQRDRSREASDLSSRPASAPTSPGLASGAMYLSMPPEQINFASSATWSKREGDRGSTINEIINAANGENDDMQRRKEVGAENLSTKRIDRNDGTKTAPVSAVTNSIAGYVYDSIKKRYFPASTFNKPNGNNDICIQRMQESTAKAREYKMISGSKGKHDECGSGNSNLDFWVHRGVSDHDISRLMFRGTSILSNFLQSEREIDTLPSPSAKTKKRRKRKNKDINSERTTYDKPSEQQCGFSSMGQSSKYSCSTRFSTNNRIPCSERTAVLLFTSLRYFTHSYRRDRIISFLGPMRIARESRIIHTSTANTGMLARRDLTSDLLDSAIRIASAEDESVDETHANKQKSSLIEQQCTKNSRYDKDVSKKMWYSMLCPIIPFRRLTELITNQFNPIPQVDAPPDCICKSYLQPTAPTFDILPAFSSSDNNLPNVVTIVNNALYFRPSVEVPPDGRDAFQLCGSNIHDVDAIDATEKPLELLRSSVTDVYQGVRFAPFSTKDDVVVGSVSYNHICEEASFSIQNTSNTRIDKKILSDVVNDFSFSPSSTLDVPGIIAFAHGGESFGTSLYDILSETYCGAYNLRTEPLCVQFGKRKGNQQIYYGHRDGTVSMLDTRAKKFHILNLNSKGSFGSATTLHLLHDENLLIAKGSFGSCRVYDLRFVQNDTDAKQRYGGALFDLPIPQSGHKTMSARCVGLAIDVSESIVSSPFINTNNGVELGIWCINTGRLIRTLDVTKRKIAAHSYSNTEDNGQVSAAFCELSSVVTGGFDFLHEKNTVVPKVRNLTGTFGAWFKTASGGIGSPFEIGGIHHLITG